MRREEVFVRSIFGAARVNIIGGKSERRRKMNDYDVQMAEAESSDTRAGDYSRRYRDRQILLRGRRSYTPDRVGACCQDIVRF